MMDAVLLADLTTPVLILVRGALAVGGALLGWIVSGPVVRTLFRLAFQRPAPGWLIPIGKLGGAVIVALLVFFYLPLGGGSGWGRGPGWGMGTAEGQGAGDSKSKGSSATKGPDSKDAKAVTATREKLEIELLGGNRITGEGRFYLVKRQPPAKTLGEVESDLKDQADKLEVHLIFVDESIATSHPAAGRLRALLRQHKIPMVETQGK